MPNFNITLSGPINITDSTSGNLIASKVLTGLTCAVTDYSSGTIAFSAAATAIPLPVSPTNFLHLQNIGTAVAVVSWIPQGGSGVIVQNLGVSSSATVVQVGQTGATGITALTVSSAAATIISYLLGG